MVATLLSSLEVSLKAALSKKSFESVYRRLRMAFDSSGICESKYFEVKSIIIAILIDPF
ncbi:hypothetical protein D3C81_1966010 [compost metagenome]